MEKHIICPRCGRRLVDTHVTNETETKILTPDLTGCRISILNAGNAVQKLELK